MVLPGPSQHERVKSKERRDKLKMKKWKEENNSKKRVSER